MSFSVDPTSLLVSAAVPAFKCPAGTKMHILNLGTLQADESWFVYANGGQIAKIRTNLNRIFRGGNASSLSNLNPVNKRRDLVLLSALIEYPGVGLILYETGCAEDLDVVCQMLSQGLLCMN